MPFEEKVEYAQRTPALFRVLGVQVNALQIPDVIRQIEAWISHRVGSHFIAVTNVHMLIETRHSLAFRRVLDSADLCVPDGMPLVWIGRLRGHSLKHRVSGPDLFWDFCRETNAKGYRHFFYGGASGVPEALAAKLKCQFPELQVVGTYSPPFRPLTSEEDVSVVEMINRTGADVLWVGLGCPKQERWIYEHRKQLHVAAMVGIGQAFDIYAGRLQRAPVWMREHGLEWLFRLLAEPRRLWRRYFIYNLEFIFCELLEFLGVKQFD